MNEATRHDIVQRFQAGQSQRRIAAELHLARATVQEVLADVADQRARGTTPAELQPRPRRPLDAPVRSRFAKHTHKTAVAPPTAAG